MTTPSEPRRPQAVALGTRIRDARKTASLSQGDLARKIDVRDGTVSRYELGDLMPSADVLLLIAQELGVSMEWLMTGVGTAPPAPAQTGTEG